MNMIEEIATRLEGSTVFSILYANSGLVAAAVNIQSGEYNLGLVPRTSLT
jgi:hypothetical protein